MKQNFFSATGLNTRRTSGSVCIAPWVPLFAWEWDVGKQQGQQVFARAKLKTFPGPLTPQEQARPLFKKRLLPRLEGILSYQLKGLRLNSTSLGPTSLGQLPLAARLHPLSGSLRTPLLQCRLPYLSPSVGGAKLHQCREVLPVTPAFS